MSRIARFYDEWYAADPAVFGGGLPEPDVVSLAALQTGGIAVEFGCGQGRNAFFLAERGFDVTAVDFSAVGIAQLQQRARDAGIALRAVVGDIAAFDVVQPVDLVISTFVLHHIEHDDALACIARWKERTRPGGFHAIAVFTRDGEFFRKDPTTKNFYPDPEALRPVYGDWNIHSYRIERSTAAQRRPDGTPMENLAAHIIAQRPA